MVAGIYDCPMLKTETSIALASTFIAAAALWLSISSNVQQRKHDRLSLRPIVGTYLLAEDDGVGVVMLNKGVGPALIMTFRFWKEAKELSFSQTVELTGLRGIINIGGWYQGLPINKTLLQNDRQYLIWYPDKLNEHRAYGRPNHSAEYMGVMYGLIYSGVTYDFCYCSVYDECWKGITTGENPVPVQDCNNFKSLVHRSLATLPQ